MTWSDSFYKITAKERRWPPEAGNRVAAPKAPGLPAERSAVAGEKPGTGGSGSPAVCGLRL